VYPLVLTTIGAIAARRFSVPHPQAGTETLPEDTTAGEPAR
jgi:hypothetical protein